MTPNLEGRQAIGRITGTASVDSVNPRKCRDRDRVQEGQLWFDDGLSSTPNRL